MRNGIDYIKNFVDLISLGTAIAVVTQAIPVIAGLLTIAWGWYRIKEIRLSIKLKEQQLEK